MFIGGIYLKSIVSLSTARAVGRFFTSGRNSGLFTYHTPHLPHSKEYLAAQLQQFKEKNRPAEIITLKKGHRLHGSDTNIDLSYGAVPLYPQGSLSQLSSNEVTRLRELGFARIADYELLEDIDCIQSKTEQGYPVYYIHHYKTSMKNPRPIDEAIETSLHSKQTSSNT